MSGEKKVLAVVFSEEDLNKKIETLKAEGIENKICIWWPRAATGWHHLKI